MSSQDSDIVGDDDSRFFRSLHARTLNTLNTNYLLPVDNDEVKRSDIHHRMLQFVFRGRNYVGPVREALQFGQQRRILDLGTGGGSWAIDMADQFPRAEVIGIDLAPIQPRSVPPNCTFELCDLAQWPIPYPDAHFDLIHSRSMSMGITDYPRFLQEIARLLRPGGLVLIIEPNLTPFIAPVLPPTPSTSIPSTSTTTSTPSTSQTEPETPIPSNPSLPTTRTSPPITPAISSAPIPIPTLQPLPTRIPSLRGWSALWETFRGCLRRRGIDDTVPQHLPTLLAATGAFERIISRDGNIPVGNWPSDPYLRTVGELQWMDYELLLPALRPLFLEADLSQSNVARLIADAQHDLYYPSEPPWTRLHIVHANKALN